MPLVYLCTASVTFAHMPIPPNSHAHLYVTQ